jgi:hypothetical protein
MRLVAILAALVLVPACTTTSSTLERNKGQADTDMGTQGGSAQQPDLGQQQGSDQQGSMQQGTLQQRVPTQQIQARIEKVNRNEGTMTVSSSGARYTLRGTPTQLQRYSEGQDASLQYQTYGQNAWLLFEGTGVGGTGEEGEPQNFSGNVSQVNRDEGTVVIGNRTFRAHPTQLQGIAEGQQISVAFQSFEGGVWLQQVQGFGGSGTQGNCGPQGTMQGGTGGSGQTDTQGAQQGTMQGGTQQGTMQGGTQQGTMQGGTQQGMAQAQQLQGKIVSINPNVGEMTVDANGKRMSLRGTPTQLQRYTKGQSVSLQYRLYGKNSWIVGEGVGGTGMDQGEAQRVTGTVSKIDLNQGSLVIGNRTYFAHPDQLQQVSQGQQITISFVPHGNTFWLRDVQTGTGGAGEEGFDPGTRQQDQGSGY